MDIYNQIRSQLQTLCQTSVVGAYLFVAEVSSVEDDTTCTIALPSGLKIGGVRLRCVVNDEETGILITPTVGSHVLVADMSGGGLTELAVIQYAEMDQMDINGGKNGGLINISDLTDKLNNLVDEVNRLKDTFNSHTHSCNLTVATTGTAAAQTGTATGTSMAPGSSAQAASKFNKDDYEDSTVTH